MDLMKLKGFCTAKKTINQTNKQKKPTVSRRKVIIKIRSEINEKEMKEIRAKIN